MISDKVTKKTLEGLGGVLSILSGLGCVALAVMDQQAQQSMWTVWVVMSLVLIINGIAMILHSRKRDDSPLLPNGLPSAISNEMHKIAKVRI